VQRMNEYGNIFSLVLNRSLDNIQCFNRRELRTVSFFLVEIFRFLRKKNEKRAYYANKP